MPAAITWTVNVQITGGPKLSASQTLTVDAYDKIEVLSPDGAADQEVEVQPGGAGQVRFLSIKSSPYGAGLTYKVNDAGADAITLDTLHLLIGGGAVGLLGDPPATLLFSNALGSSATVEILVGRNATTPTP